MQADMQADMAIDISRAKAIQGWMDDAELTWLAQQAQTHKMIVEVGCWRGRSTRALVDNTSGIVWAVDHFEGDPDTVRAFTEFPVGPGHKQLRWEFEENVNDLYRAWKVKIIKCHSVPMANWFRDTYPKIFNEENLWNNPPPMPDMVFIDASHDYESVCADIKAWREVLACGGLLCGHDYGAVGVKAAVMELLPGFEIVEGTSIWKWTKP